MRQQFKLKASAMDVAPNLGVSPLTEKAEGGILQPAIARFRTASRRRRAALLCSLFELQSTTRLLDLGGRDGVYLNACLSGTPVLPENVYIADVSASHVHGAAARFGYKPVVVAESGPLPFPDKFFDVVFCSSVLEHVTLPASEIWRERSGKRFKNAARTRQARFAAEISRVGAGYFVQVPYRWFPVESHTWLPFMGHIPRVAQVPLIGLSNRFWMKKTDPDFYLPTRGDMSRYFPEARILEEKLLGLTKSLIAVRRPNA